MMIKKMEELFSFSSMLFIFVKSLELKLPKLQESLLLLHCEIKTLTSQGETKRRLL